MDAYEYIYYGDNEKIVKFHEDESGDPEEVAKWTLDTQGAPYSFHLCDTTFERVVTATSSGYVFLIDDDELMQTRLDDDGEVFYTTNTVGVSNDGTWAYVTTLNAPPNEDVNRLYAINVTGESLPDEEDMPRCSFDATTSARAISQASPLVRGVNNQTGDYLIYYDVMKDNDDYAVCLHHDISEGTITPVWQTALEGDAIGSFAYGPVYYDGDWRDVFWTYVENERTLQGYAMEDIGEDYLAGHLVAKLTVDPVSPDLSSYKILSAVNTSKKDEPECKETLAIFNVMDKTSSNSFSYIVALELEIYDGELPVTETEKVPKWTHALEGGNAGACIGQFIIRDSGDKMTFGQINGSVISIEQVN